MKIFSAVLIGFFTVNAFACGCVDASAASAGANSINNNYDSLDKQFSVKIKKLENNIQKTIDKEKDNKKKLIGNITLEKYKILELENAIFTSKKIKEMR